jgi:hypothetical protein
MAVKRTSPRLLRRATVATMVAVTAFALLPAQSAQALGNNRDVSRSCGVNNVASGRYSGTFAWAQTTRVSGNCTGQLGAGLRASDGYTHPRVNGTRERAYTENRDAAGFGTGMHWGCLSCNVTYS